MAYSPDEYTGNGSTTTYTITFPYLDNEDVKVTLDGAATTAFTIVGGGSQIQFSVAPGSGVAIKIYRETPVDVPEATFYTGASIRAVDLNENFLQNLYYAEETREVANEATTGVIPDGSIGTPKLADGAVTTAKLSNDAVTADKLAANAVDAAAIQSGAVVAGKLGTAAVGNSNLADNSVTNAKLGDAAVNTAELADSSVTDAKIGDNVLTPYVSSINNGPLAGFRNAIINGNFDVWQRGDTFNSALSGSYSADRWFITYDVVATRNITREFFNLGQTNVPGEPTYHLRFTQAVSPSGSTFNNLNQAIESVRTFAGQQITLSFYARASTPITLPGVRVNQSFGSGGAPSAGVLHDFATNVAVGTSWQRYEYTGTLSSISGKTLGTNGNDSLILVFRLPTTGTFDFDVSQVQLEPGPVATPFERRPIGVEKNLCYRYYFQLDDVTEINTFLGIGNNGAQYTGSAAPVGFGNATYLTEMRAIPIVDHTVVTYTNCSTFTLQPYRTHIRSSTTSLGAGQTYVNTDPATIFSLDAEI